LIFKNPVHVHETYFGKIVTSMLYISHVRDRFVSRSPVKIKQHERWKWPEWAILILLTSTPRLSHTLLLLWVSEWSWSMHYNLHAHPTPDLTTELIPAQFMSFDARLPSSVRVKNTFPSVICTQSHAKVPENKWSVLDFWYSWWQGKKV
jgi:hypothetical protein